MMLTMMVMIMMMNGLHDTQATHEFLSSSNPPISPLPVVRTKGVHTSFYTSFEGQHVQLMQKLNIQSSCM